MTSKFQQNLEEHRELFARLEPLAEPVGRAAQLIATALGSGRKLMICGNGGSAADSQHLAAEFTGRFINDRRPLAAMALSTDSSALTCIARTRRGCGSTAAKRLAASSSGRNATARSPPPAPEGLAAPPAWAAAA